MRAAAVAAVAMVAACGPGLAPQPPHPLARDTLTAASGDAGAIRKLLRDEVMDGGLWFEDPACVARFPAPGMIHADRLDAFAQCLATLHFRASPREDAFIDVAVMTYSPGIEIEALMTEDGRGPRLGWIGYSARRDLADALPTIAPEALEGLRSAGDRNGPVDVAAMAKVSELASGAETREYAWVKLCLDAEGAVTKVRIRETSSLEAARVFTTAAEAWRFRPFVMGGKAIPVCAMTRMVYPPEERPSHEILPMPTPAGEEETLVVAAHQLNKRRIAGTSVILPDDRTKLEIETRGIGRVMGAFKLCVDESGHVSRVKVVRSTGIGAYDATIIRAISSWVYRPYTDGDRVVPVCTTVTFIYTQH